MDTCFAACDSGWVSGDVSCYFFSDDNVDHPTANMMCSRLGASLAKITSMEENDFITQHTSDALTIDNNYWIQGVAEMGNYYKNETKFSCILNTYGKTMVMQMCTLILDINRQAILYMRKQTYTSHKRLGVT